MESYQQTGRCRWKFRHVLLVTQLLLTLTSVLSQCQLDCVQVLTAPQGEFTSPCYPQEYPKSQACKWTLQAPSGFILQLTFRDFELEEALGCIYDRVIVSTGNADVKFCGLTANGLTLNSTGNVMEVSFNSDFSVQKRGFSVSYRQVAVALRNQKVTLSNGNGKAVTLSNSVTFPALQSLTFCCEMARSSQKATETIFSYEANSSGSGNGSGVEFSFGNNNGMELVLAAQACPVETIITASDITATMNSFCLTWTSSTGLVALYFNGNYRAKTCANTAGKSMVAGWLFRLGSQSSSLDGTLYNVRLWDYAMSVSQLAALTCDVAGNVVDWDNSYWVIPSSQAQTDSSLSCTCYPTCIHLTTAAPSSGTSVPTYTSTTTTCASPGLGCPATLTSTTPVFTNMIATNATTTVLSSNTYSTTSTSMPLTSSSTNVQPAITTPAVITISPTNMSSSPLISTTTVPHPISTAAATNTTLLYSTTQAENGISSSAPVSQTATTNTPAPNYTSHATETTPMLLISTTNLPATNLAPTRAPLPEGLFYRMSFMVSDSEASRTELEIEKTVSQWLNQTFQNWTHAVYVDYVSVYPSGEERSVQSYSCNALLVYITRSGSLLTPGEAAISAQLQASAPSMGAGLVVSTVAVQSVDNCLVETPLHYLWPESRPTVTQYVPCFPNKDQNASRTCVISPQNYTAYWDAPDLRNCTDIDTIEVSAENAAEVAVQLADITNNELSNDEVSKVVTKVKELVGVAKINATLATTVVTIISNVMTSSDTALAAASERTLKTVDELMQKIEFEGASVTITSRNLALGISALNASQFNGTSFSAFITPNTTDPQIDFESEQLNPLAQVILPATLLNNLTPTDSDISRINFMFFSKIGLFQNERDSLSLNSYVVASSVGNCTIRNLKDPVKIEIVHLNYQHSPNPVCMFWDFNMKDGTGAWNSEGCRVGPDSNGNKTVCLCDHLTHFGILMDISGAAALIDEKNTKILTFITYIGCGISAIFSAATLLTYIAFEKLRRDYPSKILMNLSTSLLFLNMLFLLDGWLASLNMHGLCVAVAVFLHYFLLSSFTWMGLESIHMYIALVKVFNTYIRRYILKFCIVGWGLPAAIVAMVVAVDRTSYGKQEYGRGDTGQGSSEFCWIQSPVVFYVTCVGYFSLVFLMNVAMFIVVMIQICGRNGKRSNRTLREEVLRNLRSVVSLTFLLGMTWGFAFFAWGPVNLAFMYLFTIFNSLQGLFIFVFHCALKENVQKQWRRYLCCGRFRLADNSDWSKTATNNTKKVSSDNLGKSLSSSSFGSSTANWTSKAKATLNPFTKRNSNTGKGYSNQTTPKCVSSCSSSSEVEPSSSSSSSSSILPVHQVIDKVKGYCSVRSDNFYKNIILSDSFSHSTKF
ncbi:adhesion G-protein coupled receptor G6 isoform X1 [Hypomesus transpacificus]|uniref:adhesion G-protein coupled receptor G6 isoform X1 n=1 Tax=Hypomesus transpacificus TaxID=137520 RepID=UPI001F07BFC6|nr:adhesion G-protein coupled receptor G6 isoform X1 [Hypomesus transpacificus]